MNRLILFFSVIVLLTGCASVNKSQPLREIASSPGPRQALDEMSRKLMNGGKSVSYLGVTAKGEVCEIFIYPDHLVFLWTQHGVIVADDVYNAHFGNPFMQDKAKLLTDTVNTDVKTGAQTTTVEASSVMDKGYVKFSIVRDSEGFKSGALNFARSNFNETCEFKTEVRNYSSKIENILQQNIHD